MKHLLFFVSAVFTWLVVACAGGSTSDNNATNVNNANNVNNVNNINNINHINNLNNINNVNNINNTNNVNNCTDQCAVQQSYCDSTVVMTCVTQPNGCLDFSAGTDCAASGMICQVNDEVASCVISCNDTCAAVGDHRCDGSELEQCTADGNGCLSFTLVEDCAASARTCTLTPAPGCACVNTCSEDACVGNVISDCATDAHGCLHPVTGADCAASSQQCRMNGTDAECYTPTGPVTLLSEDFNTWVPAGWSVVDGADAGYTWVQCNGCAYSNLSLFTTKSGAVALIDSDYYEVFFEDMLVSPSMDCSAYTSVTLEFDHYLKLYTVDYGYLDVSTDGGGSWTNSVRSWSVNTFNVHESIDLSSYFAGRANVKFRFRYVAEYDWCWMIDTVRVTAQ